MIGMSNKYKVTCKDKYWQAWSDQGSIRLTQIAIAKVAYTSPVLLANYQVPEIDREQRWFRSIPGIDIPLDSHDSIETYPETSKKMMLVLLV